MISQSSGRVNRFADATHHVRTRFACSMALACHVARLRRALRGGDGGSCARVYNQQSTTVHTVRPLQGCSWRMLRSGPDTPVTSSKVLVPHLERTRDQPIDITPGSGSSASPDGWAFSYLGECRGKLLNVENVL